jgi:hypothetical protein
MFVYPSYCSSVFCQLMEHIRSYPVDNMEGLILPYSSVMDFTMIAVVMCIKDSLRLCCWCSFLKPNSFLCTCEIHQFCFTYSSASGRQEDKCKLFYVFLFTVMSFVFFLWNK